MAQDKLKILMLCDHPLATSGVGTQARYLIDGLLRTGKYKFLVFGGAIRHESYDVIKPHDDLTIVPVDGFGGRDKLRMALAQEKPDAVFIFNDPRFFIWVWEMEDEIHQFCPLVYWHLWDQCELPPTYNRVFYESTDLINCINWPTYQMVKKWYPEKTHFVPHAVPKELFHPLPADAVAAAKKQMLPASNSETFVGLWVNRNAHRKRPGDVLLSWKMFLEELEKKHGHRNAMLVMHTDPTDQEGPNLFSIVEHFDIVKEVAFSPNRVNFPEMNVYYNVADFTINVSSAEGFGLPTLEGAMAGTPMIALKTGGLERQVVDHRDGSQNGIALDPEVKRVVGQQITPFIIEDHVSHQTVARALMQMYEMGPQKRKELGEKARAYVSGEFVYEKMVADWDRTLDETIRRFRAGECYRPWEVVSL